jgi:hypothetical protein
MVLSMSLSSALHAMSTPLLSFWLLVATCGAPAYFRQRPSQSCWKLLPCAGVVLNFAPAWLVSIEIKCIGNATYLLNTKHEANEILLLLFRDTAGDEDRGKPRDIHASFKVRVWDGDLCDRTRVMDCRQLSSGDDAANVSVCWQPVIFDGGTFEHVPGGFGSLGRSRAG